MGEKGRAEMGTRAAPGMCLELMEEEISSGPFQGGSGQLSGWGAEVVGSQEKTSGSGSTRSGQTKGSASHHS